MCHASHPPPPDPRIMRLLNDLTFQNHFRVARHHRGVVNYFQLGSDEDITQASSHANVSH